jgi:hypothetical protein
VLHLVRSPKNRLTWLSGPSKTIARRQASIEHANMPILLCAKIHFQCSQPVLMGHAWLNRQSPLGPAHGYFRPPC